MYVYSNTGPERGDQWAIGKALADTYGKQCRSAGEFRVHANERE